MTIHPAPPATVVGADISGDAQPSVVAVDFEPGHQRVLARVCGEVDIEDADELGADLAAALDVSVSGLDVDLSAVTFCDCSCLHMLFRLTGGPAGPGKPWCSPHSAPGSTACCA
ncbi:STAS domain-containing protein [Streptomyces tanashiensis]|uniref:STAS domain-containing protein n=1 Tax=Streptomyces tanashiensis TaxID=67367 RepID=A0ABY6R9Q8_9ACTN|nr:STAS domain-containing protein [Streptomyces tanashiensis]UZX26347.1 STAS domain-containing protein [Streptomyces tanashiensis]